MTTFEYPDRIEDYIEKLVRDAPQLLQYRQQLNDLAVVFAGRDDDLEAFLESDTFAPGIGVSLSTPQPVPHVTPTTITFDTLDFQSSDLFVWDGATKVTVGQRGVVSITANLLFTADLTGNLRIGTVMLNALTELVPMVGTNPGFFNAPAVGTKVWPLEAGDELTLTALQNNGGNLNTTGSLQLAFLGNVDG